VCRSRKGETLSLELYHRLKTPSVYRSPASRPRDGVARSGPGEEIAIATRRTVPVEDADEVMSIAPRRWKATCARSSQMTVEELYRTRDKSRRVAVESATDFGHMGLQIVSFTIKSAGRPGYLDALGKPKIAE